MAASSFLLTRIVRKAHQAKASSQSAQSYTKMKPGLRPEMLLESKLEVNQFSKLRPVNSFSSLRLFFSEQKFPTMTRKFNPENYYLLV